MKKLILLIGLGILCITYIVPLEDSYRIRNSPLIYKLYNVYTKNEIHFIPIIITQNYLETDKFKSKIALENNNIWGMKFNKRGYAKSKNRGHALYYTLEDGIKDFKEWQNVMMKAHEKRFSKKIISEEDYYFFLENLVISQKDNRTYRYAEDINYIRKIKKIKPLIQAEIERQKKIIYKNE